MDSDTIRLLVVAVLGVISHTAFFLGGHAHGKSLQRRKTLKLLTDCQHRALTAEYDHAELSEAHAELQHAHNQFQQNASMQIQQEINAHKETAEKLAASEQLRDEHARRNAALEEENAGLHKILDIESIKRKTPDGRVIPKGGSGTAPVRRGRPARDK